MRQQFKKIFSEMTKFSNHDISAIEKVKNEKLKNYITVSDSLNRNLRVMQLEQCLLEIANICLPRHLKRMFNRLFLSVKRVFGGFT